MKVCSTCKEEKALEEFNKNKSKKDGLSYSCKTCTRKHQKSWYNSNTSKQINRVSSRNKLIRELNIKKLYDYLIQNPCVLCGEKDPIVLEFDHLRDKKYNISDMFQKRLSWERIIEEIKKCQVLCSNCHKRKTAKDQNWTMLKYAP